MRNRRRVRWAGVLGILWATQGWPSPEPSWLGPWAGTYRSPLSPHEAKQVVDAAVVEATRGVPGLVGAKTLSLVRAQQQPPRSVEFGTKLDAMVLWLDQTRFEGQPHGVVERVRSESGVWMEMTLKIGSGVITQTLRGPDGHRVHRFTRTEQGDLQLEVEIRTSRLPRPLVYRLEYRRQR